MTRCPAPIHSEGGVFRCVESADRCLYPWHRRWDAYAPILERVWAIKPWWPNLLGWAQDHGRAHVEYIVPCRHCTEPKRVQVWRAGWAPTRGSVFHRGWERRAGRWWLRAGPYVIGDVASWKRSDAA